MTTTIKYEILLTVLDLSQGELPAFRLAMRRAITDRTLKSYIAQAREMGADIRSKRSDNGYVYYLVNWNDIEEKVMTWIELEEKGLAS